MKTGRFRYGLAQALAIWLAPAAASPLIRSATAAWAAVIVTLLAAVLLGTWHRRRSRPDSAAGAFTGALLWPAVFSAALIATNIITGAD